MVATYLTQFPLEYNRVLKEIEGYEEIMLPESLMILVNGMILDYRIISESLNESEPCDSYEITEPKLLKITDDTSTLIYSVVATRDTDSKPFHANSSSTYTLIGNDIKLILYQQTTITH